MNGINLLSSKPTNPQSGEVVIENGAFLMWDGNNWVEVQMYSGDDSHRVEELVNEFEENPDLYNQVMVEMRNRKINKIKNG